MRWVLKGLFLISILTCLAYCQSGEEELTRADLSVPVRKLATYDFHPDRSILQRIRKPIPKATLTYIRKLDNRDYRSYVLTRAEERKFINILSLMPPVHRRVFQNRVVGVYFIENFLTSGMTDYIYSQDQFYCFMILDRNVLQYNISQLLTIREKSVFKQSSGKYNVKIKVSGQDPGLLYILVHELTHAVDLVHRVSPFLEPALRKVQSNQKRFQGAKITDPYWQSYKQTRSTYDFMNRDRLTFYGFRNGPLLNATEMPALYQAWSKSPFVSIYASTIWAEDLAELVSFFHLTAIMKRTYTVNLYHQGRLLHSYHPVRSSLIQKRFKSLGFFYR